MPRCLRRVLILFLAAILVAGAWFYGLLHGWYIEKQELGELGALLKPHFQIRKPEGAGPFPTILAFHAASEIYAKGFLEWRDYFVGLGYATILVDSFTPRGMVTRADIKKVLRGRLMGPERAGDVLAALEEARRLPFVDADRMAIAGWSHGAWTIMDLLAMNPPQELPTNLRHCPAQPLRGVQAAVLLYPYCGVLARAHARGWPQDIKVLLLMAGRDTRVSNEACREIVDILKREGRPIRAHTYPSANHVFDFRAEDLKDYPDLAPDPEATADARERVARFLSEAMRPAEAARAVSAAIDRNSRTALERYLSLR